MNIVEHNDNIVTKVPTDVERYLLRIIQRYFDMFNVDNANSIEAIVVESLIRMKRDIMHEKSFVFSINGKAGHIALTASDIYGEPAFNKNTAFNKDFAPAGKFRADTICEGNDPRLNDKRTPNPHNHNRYDNFVDRDGVPIVDLNGKLLFRSPQGLLLSNLLEQCNVISGESSHTHVNFTSVLDKLRYTGTRTEIDLAYLEIAKKNLQYKIDEINGLCDGFSKRVTTALSGLNVAKQQTQDFSDWATAFAKIPPTWYDDAVVYTDKVVKGFENYCKRCIDSAVKQEELQTFIEKTEKYLHCIDGMSEGLLIGRGPIEIEGKISKMRHLIELPVESKGKKIQRVDAYLRYDDTIEIQGKTITNVVTVPLPFVTKEPDGTYIVVTCTYSSGKATIESSVRAKIPFNFSSDCVYNNDLIILKRNEQSSLQDSSKNHLRLCVIDSDNKIEFIKANVGIDKKYFINGFADDDLEWTLILNGLTNEPTKMTYFKWDNNFKDKKIIMSSIALLNTEGFMEFIEELAYAEGYSEDIGYLYEFVPPAVEDYYKNARICYQIYVGEGD